MGYFDSDEKEMLEVYMLETRQLLEQLDGFLLEAEKNHAFTESEIHAVFRIMHTIKGSSAMMRLSDLSRTAHKLEDLFAYYRETYGVIKDPEPELFDLLFTVSDYIAKELEGMSLDSYQPHPASDIEIRAEEYLRAAKQGRREDGGKQTEEIQETRGENAEEPERIPENFDGKGGVIVRIKLEEGCRLEHIRAFMLVRQIEGHCSCVESFPEHLDKAQSEAEYISRHGVLLRFESQEKNKVLDILRGGLFVASCEIVEDRTIRAVLPTEHTTKDDRESAEKKEAEFLNVRTDRLDRLQNLAGEMMIQMLTLDDALRRAGLEEIREGTAYQLNRLIGDVEKTVMEMRMVPVNSLVPKLRRIFRDICRVQKKDVEFVASCGDIEADKSVVEYVFEALMHIIRNAVDHGIETPAERAASGKEKTGKIVFTAESTVGELILSIQDDGRGIDAEKIKASAKKKGLLEKPEDAYDTQELWELILSPGFTTQEKVTDYSGRGVGLDVVKNIMEEAGGHLYIDSEAGKGSKFTIMLPLTLSTIECVRFRVGECRFSLPARYVSGFMEYREKTGLIQELKGGTSYIMMSEKMVPLIDLHRFYHLQGKTEDTAIIICLKKNDKEYCIIADSMYEQKRIVVKPLPPLFGTGFRRFTGISGLSMMGNGRICSALDVEILVNLYVSEGGYRIGH
ncbi:chemotaxis protein CheA [Ruminococcus gauvreauii]|uniref:Chemotaxis protein CheA n=1 Tax=Ruminococcus gauvreauii TaxID=438033 RepID=A0ABY5VFF2_9FIRM|nr:ATP-binding protein [Ruminococcus gauvreauii]UWP59134.1 ATP-binding protein [Ruminococcus gauvreauii]